MEPLPNISVELVTDCEAVFTSFPLYIAMVMVVVVVDELPNMSWPVPENKKLKVFTFARSHVPYFAASNGSIVARVVAPVLSLITISYSYAPCAFFTVS